MGLMLSILISCVGVVELLAFYTNVRRLVETPPTNNDRLNDVGKYYIGELHRERNRLLREISRVEARDINTKEQTLLSRTEVQSYADGLQTIPQTPRNATDICSGDFASKQSITVTESPEDVVQHDPVHGDREPSPYPTYENLAPRRSLCSDLLEADTVSVREIDEDETRSPSPRHEDLLRSNFDSQDYWSKQTLRVRRKSKSRSRSRTPEILAQDRLDFEQKTTQQVEVHQDSPPSSSDVVEGRYWKRSPSPFQKVLDMYESTTKRDTNEDDEDTGVTITEIEEEVDSNVLNSVDGLRHQQTNEDTKRSFRKKKRDKKKFRKAPLKDNGEEQSSFSDHEGSSIASTLSDDLEASKSSTKEDAINPSKESSTTEPFWVNR